MATRDELTSLRPGSAVRIEGEGFMLERTIRFDEHGGNVWFEHRFSSDASGRSLWLEVPAAPSAPVIVYDMNATLDFVPDGGPEIEHGGERLPLLVSGRATYRSVERSAAAKRGELVYYEYGEGDRRVTYENRGDDTVWEISEGRSIEPDAIEVLV